MCHASVQEMEVMGSLTTAPAKPQHFCSMPAASGGESTIDEASNTLSWEHLTSGRHPSLLWKLPQKGCNINWQNPMSKRSWDAGGNGKECRYLIRQTACLLSFVGYLHFQWAGNPVNASLHHRCSESEWPAQWKWASYSPGQFKHLPRG